LVLSNIRLPYSLAIRGQGPLPGKLSVVNEAVHMPLRAAMFSAVVSFLYLGLWYASLNELFGRFIGLDEIPIVMVYGLYFMLYIWYMRNFKDLSFGKRFIKPAFAMLGALIILYGGITNPSIGLYLLISLGVLVFGLIFYNSDAKAD